jgi:dTDP-glucose pyrophosphorylase
MINVLVLLSGSSKNFLDEGYAYPKNLVDLGGGPLVQHVLNRLECLMDSSAQLLCIVRRDENIKYHTAAVIKLIDPRAIVFELNSDNSGAACSALLAIEEINNNVPLMIVNGDQLVDENLNSVLNSFQVRGLDGGILVFEDLHPRWSFVKCDKDNYVVETAEKRPISKLATAGVYYFAKGRDFVLGASEMLKKDAHVNGAFYICPTFNELILRQRKIGTYMIPRKNYHPLTSPVDVQAYISKTAI